MEALLYNFSKQMNLLSSNRFAKYELLPSDGDEGVLPETTTKGKLDTAFGIAANILGGTLEGLVFPNYVCCDDPAIKSGSECTVQDCDDADYFRYLCISELRNRQLEIPYQCATVEGTMGTQCNEYKKFGAPFCADISGWAADLDCSTAVYKKGCGCDLGFYM